MRETAAAAYDLLSDRCQHDTTVQTASTGTWFINGLRGDLLGIRKAGMALKKLLTSSIDSSDDETFKRNIESLMPKLEA